MTTEDEIQIIKMYISGIGSTTISKKINIPEQKILKISIYIFLN
jgi:hypothetical protein